VGSRLRHRRRGLFPGHPLQRDAGGNPTAKNFTLQIFATDLDQQAIEKARPVCSRPTSPRTVSAKRLNRYFDKVSRGYQVAKSIREMVIFAPQNIIMDPPFTKLDLVSCRNLLIYLTPELQKHLLPLFYYSLNPGGFLFLGARRRWGTSPTCSRRWPEPRGSTGGWIPP